MAGLCHHKGLALWVWPYGDREGHCLFLGTDVGIWQHTPPHSRFSASLQPTGQLDYGKERQELEAADFVYNLSDLRLLPNTHTICSLAQKAQEREALVSGVGWWGSKGTPEIGYRPECLVHDNPG